MPYTGLNMSDEKKEIEKPGLITEEAKELT